MGKTKTCRGVTSGLAGEKGGFAAFQPWRIKKGNRLRVRKQPKESVSVNLDWEEGRMRVDVFRGGVSMVHMKCDSTTGHKGTD